MDNPKSGPRLEPLADQPAEARRIVDRAREQGVILRLLGGLAARVHCQEFLFCTRDYSDIDVMGLSRQRPAILHIFDDLGYKPHQMFNAINGQSRLEFIDSQHDRHVDVFLDVFRMDHALDLRGRLQIEPYTISLGDLMLTKLQIVRINQKDVRDLFTLLKDLSIGNEDKPGIVNIPYIALACARDWGLHHTVVRNLQNMARTIDDYPLATEEKAVVLERIHILLQAIDASAKGLKWRLRALLGERIRWYEEVEEPQ
jgi:hypothetical protein